MALPFFNRSLKSKTQVLVIDLGSRTTKAVHLQRKGSTYDLINYVIEDAPEGNPVTPEALGDHLKKVSLAAGGRSRKVVVALRVGDSLLRRAELPQVPVSDMRAMLKLGSKNYLQQDLPNYLFDCSIIPRRLSTTPNEPSKGKPKCTVLVGGAQRAVVQTIKAAARHAGLIVEEIAPNLVGAPNAFEIAEPESFAGEVVALADMGFRNTTVTILMEGELMLSRVLGFGGDQLTQSLSNSLGIGYSEAEGIKVGLSSEVEDNLQEALMPLARELRASIDFFEHQHDKPVKHLFASGGTARSEFLIQCLQNELMIPCRVWNPAGKCTLSLPPHQRGEIEQSAPQLTVALGIAASTLN